MLQYISGAVISNGLRKNIEIVQSIEWPDRIGSDSGGADGAYGGVMRSSRRGLQTRVAANLSWIPNLVLCRLPPV